MVPDKMNAIARCRFKQQLLVIRESDPDMERRIDGFQPTYCQAFAWHVVRPISKLTAVRKTLTAGSTRPKFTTHASSRRVSATSFLFKAKEGRR